MALHATQQQFIPYYVLKESYFSWQLFCSSGVLRESRAFHGSPHLQCALPAQILHPQVPWCIFMVTDIYFELWKNLFLPLDGKFSELLYITVLQGRKNLPFYLRVFKMWILCSICWSPNQFPFILFPGYRTKLDKTLTDWHQDKIPPDVPLISFPWIFSS